jgi:hypothetical protein
MTTPLLIREQYDTEPAFKRAVRDALNSLIRRTLTVGTTAQRPAAPVVGQQYYDTTLAKPIWWSGAAWKDGSSAAV